MGVGWIGIVDSQPVWLGPKKKLMGVTETH